MTHGRRVRAVPGTPLRSLLLLLVLSALAALAACGGDAPPARSGGEGADGEAGHGAGEEEHAEGVVELSADQLREAGVDTAAAGLRPLPAQLETTGEVDYEQDRIAHVSPRIPGRIEHVSASLGDEVARGEVLAVLDSVELGQAKSRFLAARTREELARENLEREEELFEDRISSEKEMLEARAAYRQAVAERDATEQTLHLYGLSQERIEGLEPGAGGASHLPVRSPIAGRVVEKHATLGELATPERSLFTVADLSRVWVWIDVFERDLAAVHREDDVEVRVSSFPGRSFNGEVSYLSPEVDPETRTVRARIDVANPDRLLRPGMFATVELTDPHLEDVESVVVPEEAVIRVGGETVVFVPADPAGTAEHAGPGDHVRFEVRPVEAGRRVGGLVEILSGLVAGERVVTGGAFFLKSELARGELGGGHSH